MSTTWSFTNHLWTLIATKQHTSNFFGVQCFWKKKKKKWLELGINQRLTSDQPLVPIWVNKKLNQKWIWFEILEPELEIYFVESNLKPDSWFHFLCVELQPELKQF